MLLIFMAIYEQRRKLCKMTFLCYLLTTFSSGNMYAFLIVYIGIIIAMERSDSVL